MAEPKFMPAIWSKKYHRAGVHRQSVDAQPCPLFGPGSEPRFRGRSKTETVCGKRQAHPTKPKKNHCTSKHRLVSNATQTPNNAPKTHRLGLGCSLHRCTSLAEKTHSFGMGISNQTISAPSTRILANVELWTASRLTPISILKQSCMTRQMRVNCLLTRVSLTGLT